MNLNLGWLPSGIRVCAGVCQPASLGSSKVKAWLESGEGSEEESLLGKAEVSSPPQLGGIKA